jgi:hypothetical protein
MNPQLYLHLNLRLDVPINYALKLQPAWLMALGREFRE